MNMLNRYGKMEQLLYLLRAEIACGEHGEVGTPFIPVRDLAEKFEVSHVTAHRVLERLKELGILNKSGRRLCIARREKNTIGTQKRKIGVLVTNIDNPFFSGLVNAIELAGRHMGIEILSAGSDYNIDNEAKQLKMLKDSGVDGFLICPAHDQNSRSNLEKLTLPYVVIGRRMVNFKCDVVTVNNFEVGRLVARHMINSMCTNFFYASIGHFNADERRLGYTAELAAHNYKLLDENIIDLEKPKSISPERLKNLCSGKKSGVFCYHDLAAMRILRIAKIGNIQVPQELAIVGVDNLPVASEIFPSLSSVAYPVSRIAKDALERLVSKINGGATTREQVILFDPELIIRESSHEY